MSGQISVVAHLKHNEHCGPLPSVFTYSQTQRQESKYHVYLEAK